MNKKLIALAITGALAAPLAAQAELTISGMLQAEVASVGGDGAVEGVIVTDGMEYGTENAGNASAINFAGSQDLGGGMKAVAKAGFNLWPADHGANGWGPRDAYVGLAGGFGTVLIGTMNTPYKASTVGWDPFLATSLQARGSFGMSGVGHNGYAQNVVAYANNFGDVKFVGALSADEAIDADGDRRGDHTSTFSVNAPIGPVEVALAYLNVDALDDGTATKVGVKYSTGAFTIAGQYENLDEDIGDGSQAYVTGSMAMGANTVSISYGQFDDDSGADVDADYWAIGATHAFSKSVRAHVGYRASDTDVDNTDVNVFAAGLRVGF